jgi:branched-chain amino acid transport system substrate-binding protein
LRGTTSRLLLIGAIAIATLAGARHADAEILIGYAGPLTGEMELAGEQMRNGVDLAVDELNAAGGVLGQNLALDLADDYCDAEQGMAAARKLVADGWSS